MNKYSFKEKDIIQLDKSEPLPPCFNGIKEDTFQVVKKFNTYFIIKSIIPDNLGCRLLYEFTYRHAFYFNVIDQIKRGHPLTKIFQ